MAEIDPSDMKVRIRLAELYARDGNLEKAADQYVAIAEELVRKGHLAEALQLIEKARADVRIVFNNQNLSAVHAESPGRTMTKRAPPPSAFSYTSSPP